jgi:hypothetical protein
VPTRRSTAQFHSAEGRRAAKRSANKKRLNASQVCLPIDRFPVLSSA